MTKMTMIWAVAVAGAMAVAGPALAQGGDRVHATAPEPTNAAPHPASSFYPETIEGGSPGNLPFNNQVRKLRDPLNANGAGR